MVGMHFEASCALTIGNKMSKRHVDGRLGIKVSAWIKKTLEGKAV